MKKIRKNKKTEQKKYKIQEILDNLPKKEHDIIVKKIPKEIGRCNSSFMQYKSILLGEKEELPYIIGIKIEKIFGLEPGTLYNGDITCRSYKELLEGD